MQALLAVGGLTAVTTANDLLAMGAYDALEEAGVAVPEGMSVTGFNDMPLMDRVAPPLTAVRIQHATMGRLAAEALLGRLCGTEAPAKSVRLAPQLVVRASTAAYASP